MMWPSRENSNAVQQENNTVNDPALGENNNDNISFPAKKTEIKTVQPIHKNKILISTQKTYSKIAENNLTEISANQKNVPVAKQKDNKLKNNIV